MATSPLQPKLPSSAEVARAAPDRSRARGPARRLRRWLRRSTARDIAMTMIVLGFAFLVLALTLLLVVTDR